MSGASLDQAVSSWCFLFNQPWPLMKTKPLNGRLAYVCRVVQGNTTLGGTVNKNLLPFSAKENKFTLDSLWPKSIS